MEFMLKFKYSWPTIHVDIEDTIKKCERCLKAGGERVNTKNQPIKVNAPNELWECDLIGRIQDETGKNKFIFVAIDHYTKWIETRVIKQKTAVAEAVETLIVKKHGAPGRILSDNGLEFKNNEIDALCKEYGITWVYNSPGHHEAVGAVERANKTLMEKIRKLCNFGESSWEAEVENATRGVNYSFNRSIRTSPFIIKFGKAPTLSIDKELKREEVIIPKTDSVNERDRHIQEYYEKDIVKGKITAAGTAKVGDPVLIYKEKLGEKLGSSWTPGYTVDAKIGEHSYVVSKENVEKRLNKKHVKLDTSQNGGREVSVL